MIIQAFRQDGCKLYYKNESNQWIEFANISACNVPSGGFDNLTDEEYSGIVRAISDYMQILVQDYLGNVALIEAGTKTIGAAVGGIIDVYAKGVGTAIAIVIEGIVDLGSAFVSASYDPNQIQNAECYFFYLLQRYGYSYKTLTDWVVYIENTYPSKFANPWIRFYSDSIATIDESGWSDRALIGKLSPNPDMGVLCTTNPLPEVCILQAAHGGSVTQVNGKWRLQSSVTPRTDGKYYSTFSTTSLRECRILSMTDNNAGSGQTYAVYVVEEDSSFVLVNDVNGIVGYCFSELHIESSAPFSLDIELKTCSEQQSANDGRLFLNDSTQPIRIAVPIALLDYGDGGNIFNLSSSQTAPDANGWHHYYLENADDCYQIREVPVTYPGETPVNYGIQAAEIKVWDCDNNEKLLSATALRTTPECFSRIAFRTTPNNPSANPAYLYRVSVTPCIASVWCCEWDLTDSQGGWIPFFQAGQCQTVWIDDGDGFRGSGASNADRTIIYRTLPEALHITRIELEYNQQLVPSVNWFVFDCVPFPTEAQPAVGTFKTPNNIEDLGSGNRRNTWLHDSAQTNILFHIQYGAQSSIPAFKFKKLKMYYLRESPVSIGGVPC